jgi:TonB family protein
VSHPRIQQMVVPVYPPIAESARVSGTVTIDAIIDETGRVANATIGRSIPLLDAVAISSVRQWKFEPPRFNGRGVRFATTVTFNFQLFDVSAPPPLNAQRFDSGMPADFAVVYDDRCLLVRRPSPCMTTLTTSRHDLAPVFRELSEAGLVSRTEGLRVWREIGAAEIAVANFGVSVAVAGVSPRVDMPGVPYELFVRSDGVWRRLWPPFSRGVPADYEKQLAPARALIERIIGGK